MASGPWIFCNPAYRRLQLHTSYTNTLMAHKWGVCVGGWRLWPRSDSLHPIAMDKACPAHWLTLTLAQHSRWAALLSQSPLNEAADCSCCELNTTADSHHGSIKPPKACKHLTTPAFCKLSRAVWRPWHVGLWWLNLCGVKTEAAGRWKGYDRHAKWHQVLVMGRGLVE